jgi:hypothetical protein
VKICAHVPTCALAVAATPATTGVIDEASKPDHPNTRKSLSELHRHGESEELRLARTIDSIAVSTARGVRRGGRKAGCARRIGFESSDNPLIC